VIVVFVYIFSFTVLFTLRAFQKTTFTYRDVAVPSHVFLLVLLMVVIAANLLFVPIFERTSPSSSIAPGSR